MSASGMSRPDSPGGIKVGPARAPAAVNVYDGSIDLLRKSDWVHLFVHLMLNCGRPICSAAFVWIIGKSAV